jgi:hypothetical protein
MVFFMMYQLFILKSFMASRLIDPVTHYCSVLDGEAANTNFRVFDSSRARIHDLLHSMQACFQLHHRCVLCDSKAVS